MARLHAQNLNYKKIENTLMKKSFALITLGAILEYYDFAIFIYFAKSIGESLIPIHYSTAVLFPNCQKNL